MKKVILDTNALLFPFQFKIDLKSELSSLLGSVEMLVPGVVIRELKGLADGGNFDARAALRYTLDFPDRFTVFDDDEKESGNVAEKSAVVDVGDPEGILKSDADAVVLSAAVKVDGILVTSDKGLIRRAKAKGLKVVFLRGRQKLELK